MPAAIRQSVKGFVLGWKEVAITYLHLHFNYRSGVTPAQQWCLWTLWFRVTGGISRPVTICHQSCPKGCAWALNIQCCCAHHSPWIKAGGFLSFSKERQLFLLRSKIFLTWLCCYLLDISWMFSFEMPRCVQGQDTLLGVHRFHIISCMRVLIADVRDKRSWRSLFPWSLHAEAVTNISPQPRNHCHLHLTRLLSIRAFSQQSYPSLSPSSTSLNMVLFWFLWSPEHLDLAHNSGGYFSVMCSELLSTILSICGCKPNWKHVGWLKTGGGISFVN